LLQHGDVSMPYVNFSRRIRKYQGKIDADVIRSRISALRDFMIELEQEQFANLVALEEAVKKELGEQGVSTIQMPFYLNVAREVYKVKTRHSGKTADAEVLIIRDKWIKRGLDPTLVDLTIRIAYGYVPAY